MTAAAILETLASRGAVLRPNGGKIRVIPSGVLDGELREAIAAHRAELLAWLEVGQLPATGCTSPATDRARTANGFPLEWDAGEAFRATFRNPCRNPNRPGAQSTSERQSQSAPGAVVELPPALLERPGLELCPDGLWRAGGLIVPTRGTRPALAKYFCKIGALPKAWQPQPKPPASEAPGEVLSGIDRIFRIVDAIEAHAGKWRGISGTIECPVCREQTLRYAVSSYNGHKRGGCSNQCGSFVQ